MEWIRRGVREIRALPQEAELNSSSPSMVKTPPKATGSSWEYSQSLAKYKSHSPGKSRADQSVYERKLVHVVWELAVMRTLCKGCCCCCLCNSVAHTPMFGVQKWKTHNPERPQRSTTDVKCCGDEATLWQVEVLRKVLTQSLLKQPPLVGESNIRQCWGFSANMSIKQSTPLSNQHQVNPSTTDTAQRDGVVCYIWPCRSVLAYVRLQIISWLYFPPQEIRVQPLPCCPYRIRCIWSRTNTFLIQLVFIVVVFSPT